MNKTGICFPVAMAFSLSSFCFKVSLVPVGNLYSLLITIDRIPYTDFKHKQC